MKVVKTIAEFRKLRRQLANPTGFVPTMGYLHEGHLSLVRYARAENESVIASIFVNPTQFGPREDFKAYPRDTERDLSMLEKEKTDVVFMPEATEIYPEGFSTWIDVEKVTERLEGTSRPSHFRGVTTVVAKLFNIVEPDVAYFGQKDAQQATVIKKMAAELNMNLKVVTLPTVREPDGLAMSSRNTYLNPKQRKAATVLYRALSLAKHLHANGEKDAAKMRREMMEILLREPLAGVDYVSIADNETLEELDRIKTPSLVSLAVKIGTTRLIDNVILE
ncbi:pantoate--beta-alanine ligase [Chloroflexota bacterium]